MTKRIYLLIAVLLVAVTVPVLAAGTQEHYEIVQAIHGAGVCEKVSTRYADTFTLSCEIRRLDFTDKLQEIADGNPVFMIDTTRSPGGLFTQYGLAWQMPSSAGRNYRTSFVVYRKSDGILRQLSVRDGCWYNLRGNRVWCPARVLLDGVSGMDTDALLVV